MKGILEHHYYMAAEKPWAYYVNQDLEEGDLPAGVHAFVPRYATSTGFSGSTVFYLCGSKRAVDDHEFPRSQIQMPWSDWVRKREAHRRLLQLEPRIDQLEEIHHG